MPESTSRRKGIAAKSLTVCSSTHVPSQFRLDSVQLTGSRPETSFAVVNE